MPFFRVLLHGSGLGIPSADGVGPIAGFYATRFVRADRESDAVTKAISNLHQEWGRAPLAAKCRGRNIQLVVDEIEQVSVLAKLLGRKRGYTFYSEE